MGTPYTFDEGMSCRSTRIELFYFDDNFRRIAQWVPPFTRFRIMLFISAHSLHDYTLQL